MGELDLTLDYLKLALVAFVLVLDVFNQDFAVYFVLHKTHLKLIIEIRK